MTGRPTLLERTFQLARGGEYAGLGDIRAALKAEGYDGVGPMTSGRTLTAQIRAICLAARAMRAAAPETVASPFGGAGEA